MCLDQAEVTTHGASPVPEQEQNCKQRLTQRWPDRAYTELGRLHPFRSFVYKASCHRRQGRNQPPTWGWHGEYPPTNKSIDSQTASACRERRRPVWERGTLADRW